MFEWLRRRSKIRLSGAPNVRRLKTYSSQAGYVYQYVYEGQRGVVHEREHCVEFVFGVSADRGTRFPASVFIGDSAFDRWQESRKLQLTSAERYAVAKMALFQAFDERETPQQMRSSIFVRPADAEAILEVLGIG